MPTRELALLGNESGADESRSHDMKYLVEISQDGTAVRIELSEEDMYTLVTLMKVSYGELLDVVHKRTLFISEAGEIVAELAREDSTVKLVIRRRQVLADLRRTVLKVEEALRVISDVVSTSLSQ